MWNPILDILSLSLSSFSITNNMFRHFFFFSVLSSIRFLNGSVLYGRTFQTQLYPCPLPLVFPAPALLPPDCWMTGNSGQNTTTSSCVPLIKWSYSESSSSSPFITATITSQHPHYLFPLPLECKQEQCQARVMKWGWWKDPHSYCKHTVKASHLHTHTHTRNIIIIEKKYTLICFITLSVSGVRYRVAVPVSLVWYYGVVWCDGIIMANSVYLMVCFI